MHENLKKVFCLSSSAILLANQMAVVGQAAPYENNDLFQIANESDIETLANLADGSGKNFLASNLLHKRYKLNVYELCVLSILVDKQLEEEKLSANDKKELLALRQNLRQIYHSLTGKYPDTKNLSGTDSEKKNNIPSSFNFPKEESTSSVSPKREGKDNAVQSYKDDIKKASSPQELATAMSVINIKATPSKEEEEDSVADDISPASDFSGGAEGKLSKISESTNIENYEPWQYDEFASLAEDFLTETEKSERRFYMQAYHNLKYVEQRAEGNVPLDTSVVDDKGHYYKPIATNQHELEESIDVGFGVRVHKCLDLLFGISATNDDGMVGRPGTKLKFSNVLFKFHPERIKNKTGVKIRMDGSVISTNIPGTNAGIGVDTSNGGIGISVDGTSIGYSDENGVTFSKDGVSYTDMNSLSKQFGKYFIGIGKLSLNFSTYTLQLSDCKAVEIGYKDGMEGLTFVYAKPQSSEEGYSNKEETKKGIYDRILYAAQYATKRLVPTMDIAFNFAHAKDIGSLTNPAGATKTTSTVYSIAFQSNEKLRNTQFQGELARSVNSYGIGTPNTRQVTGNADYLDISHKFSNKLSGSLHLVNIDGSFNSSSMVEDKTGDSLLTDNDGDGKPDYLYESGQRGFDLSLAYRFPNVVNVAFGLSRYTLSTNGGGYTDAYIAAEKNWNLSDGGTFGIQQRFEHRNAASETWVHNSSQTTFSLEGVSPWKDSSVSSHLQVIRDKVEGNDRRFDLSVAQNFYPLERVIVTPKFEYSSKKGDIGLDKEAAEDSTTIINSLTIGYEVIPDELVVNLLISKEKYDIISADIDESTGRNVDGERRNVFGSGLGLVWRPKGIDGLEAALSYRRDRVHYFQPKDDWSSQDVWDAKLSYSHNLGQKLQASLSYDYHTAKDHIKPIYDEVTQTIELNLDANLGDDSYIRLSHSYSKYYKPLDASSNNTESTTTISMSNKF